MGREKELTKTSCTLNNGDVQILSENIWNIGLHITYNRIFPFFSLICSPCLTLSPADLGEENQWQHKDENLSGTAAARCFCDSSAISCMTVCSSLVLFFFSLFFLLKPIEKPLMGYGSLFTLILEAENAVITSYETVCGWPHYSM